MLALASRIESVVVYAEGARVRRVAPVPAEATGQVRLTGLPLCLEDASVRARMDGEGDLPRAVDLRVSLEVPDGEPGPPPAGEAEWLAAQDEAAATAARVEQLEADLAALDVLAVAPRPPGAEGEPPIPSPGETRLGLIALRAELDRAIRADRAAARRAADDAARRLADLTERRRRASTARAAREHELRKTVVVTLAGGGGPSRLSIDYVVPGARWAPVYTVRLDGAAAAVSLRAAVAQRTGEDWNAVALTLSTADALGWSELPELQSLRIGRAQPPVRKTGWRPPPQGAAELYRDYERAFASLRAAPAVPPPKPRPAPAPMSPPAAPIAPPPPVAPAAAPEPHEAAAGEPARSRRERRKRDEAARTAVGAAPPAAGAMPPAPGPVPAFAVPAPARVAPQSAPSGGAPARAPAPAGTTLESTAAAALDVRLMAYADLRMPGPGDPRRGELVVAQRQEVYLAVLQEQRVSVSFDVVGAVERAGAAARSIEPAPPRCRLARADRYDHAFAADALADVASDGTFHAVPLQSRPAQVALSHVCVPRESTDVFRFARFRNPFEAPLLPGPADVYQGRELLLTADLPFTPPGGEARLGLGVDQAVRVARNARFAEEAAGLVRSSLVLHHDIDVEIANQRDTPVQIEVCERVPVLRSGEKDIEVETREVSPPWRRFVYPASEPAPALLGGWAWDVTVPPAGKVKLHAGYDVRIAAKLELVGGNRREG